MSKIHPTAMIDAKAVVADDVEIGAYSVIGPQVYIGQGTIIGPHVVIQGPTEIGENCHIFQFSSIGEMPQDKKYQGEPTRLIIGARNTIREFVSINRGTVQDQSETRIGDDNWIMANVHIAHDCIVGSRIIFANGASLAGHAIIEDDVVLGGYTMVYQRCRIGAHAITGFSSGIHKDVPPFITAAGYRAQPAGINSEGLKRRGYSTASIQATKTAYRILYRQNLSLQEALIKIESMTAEFPHLAVLVKFLSQPTERGIVRRE